ncbi:MAG TPA: beta-ketoacyl synthase N-terminal-like domain-containing protein [Chthoniobacterales bacterium]|nr:beta-ketoacyl synthase N-terminal-like domain-containing protein [Chthoniobacterales bacterium]
MSLGIAGMGWVTPLGSSLAGVWARLLGGDTAAAESVSSPLGRACSVFPVPAEATAKAPAHPRLRRSSAISRFAVVAGLAALEDAKLTLDADTATRTALVFAVSNGGVVYTKRFYHEIVEAGSQAASPLLFPETVFNAPASHLAAILGINGASYTLVGDGAVGVLALKMAEDLMRNDRLDHCLVVGAEEADWLLCDAYRKWRLLRSTPPIEPFQTPPRGTILSEGAGAILLSRNGSIQLEKIAAGTNFRRQSEAGDAVEKVFAELCDGETDLVVASANGTFVDAAEDAAIERNCPGSKVLAIKGALGESVGASSLWQTICGAQALRTQLVPPDLLHRRKAGASPSAGQLRRAVVSVCGLNQQAAGLRLARN